MSNKTKIILLSAAIVCLFFFFSFLLSLLKPSQQETPTITTPTPANTSLSQTQPDNTAPTPTSIINASPPPKQQAYETILIPYLPYISPEFDIEYYNTSRTFVVTIKDNPYEENKKKAQLWFYDRGIPNLADLKIIYNNYAWVY